MVSIETPRLGKPTSEWHNYQIGQDRKFGIMTGMVFMPTTVATEFQGQLQKRANRNTGLRFKVYCNNANMGAGSTPMLIFHDKSPQIWPEESAHTNKYSSGYSRLETYVPGTGYVVGGELPAGEKFEVALSVSKKELPAVLDRTRAILAQGLGIKMAVSGQGAVQPHFNPRTQQHFDILQIYGEGAIKSVLPVLADQFRAAYKFTRSEVALEI